MAVLYRKYRPQIFADVVGQKSIIQTLKNQVAGGSFAHAYLFTGSRGVGKTSVARIMAKAVNCESASRRIGGSEPSLSAEGGHLPQKGESNNVQALPDALGDACGECSVCKQIEQGNFIDLVEIDAASNTGVDNIRELIEHVKFSPSVGNYKVFIIDEVHMLSKGAFNALLKTLEEPPKHAIFILATTEIGKVPPTIISRTQRFDFKALSSKDIFDLLKEVCKKEGVDFNNSILELLANNAEGSVRDALSLLGKVSTLGTLASLEEAEQLLGITDFGTAAEFLEIIRQSEAQKVPEFLNQLAQKGADYAIFNRDFLEFLRKVLIAKIGGGAIHFGLAEQHEEKLTTLAESFSVPELIYITRLFLKAYKDLPFSPVPQVPLLIAGIEAATRKSASPPAGEAGRQIGESENRNVGRSVSRKVGESEGRIIGSDVEMSVKSDVNKPPVVRVESENIPQSEVGVVETGDLASLDEIQAAWPKIIAKVKEINGPLASMLKNTQLLQTQPGKIIVSVKFAFDKKSLEIPKNSQLIVAVIGELVGKKLSVVGQVINNQPATAVGATEAVAEALKIFGGELVE